MNKLKIFSILIGLIFLVACGNEKTYKDGKVEGYRNGFDAGLKEIATQINIDSVKIYCDSLLSNTAIFVGKSIPDTNKINAGIMIIIPDSTTYLIFNGGYYTHFDILVTSTSN